MKRVVFSLIVVLIGALFCGIAEDSQLRIGENLRHESVLLPPSMPDIDRLVVLDYLMVINEKVGIGILVLYDDDRTKRPLDCVELYSVGGDLLLVSWVDPFGVIRVAMDIGLINDQAPTVIGLLVIIAGGTAL